MHALERLRDAQRHRGPDDAGIWSSPDHRIGLAHRRLSIIDLSPRGHQPMSTPDGGLTITFNGEIYNHVELRKELERSGATFQSDSDTEVILLGYRQWGPGLVDRLRGMFAFAIWDDRSRDLFLARDALGIKPLYFVEHDGKFAFASEVRALGAIVDLGPVDVHALTEFLMWGSISSPATLHSRARALEPGKWMVVRDDRARVEKTYWRIEDAFRGADPLDEEEAFARIAIALRDSVRHHLVADVPVGAFLSGGVDSISLVALLTEVHGRPIETVTLACDDPALDERELAASAARIYGTRHHEIQLDIEEIRLRIPEAIAAMDQPTIDGINTYLVSEAARRAGLKVAVSGVGGDELFGGYDTFRQIPRFLAFNRSLHRIPGGRSVSALSTALLGRPRLPRSAGKVARILEQGSTIEGAYFAARGLFSPSEVRKLIHPDLLLSAGMLDPVKSLSERIDIDAIPRADQVSALEHRQYLQAQLLRDTDAASMAHSLEVRTPLVDRTLLCEVARVPAAHRFAGPAKRALRTAPALPVEPRIWNRRKRGFTLPFDKWLRSGRLELPFPTKHPAFDSRAIDDVARRFKSGEVHWSRIWALMVIQQFLGDGA